MHSATFEEYGDGLYDLQCFVSGVAPTAAHATVTMDSRMACLLDRLEGSY